MEQLRDIKGLNQISIWPLAYGWWIIIGLLLLIGMGGFLVSLKKKKYKNSWKFKANEKLQILMSKKNQPSIISDLFELLKEISLLKFGRSKCANLTGEEWLKWLSKNDKSGFNWTDNAINLVKMQYRPHVEIKKKLQQKNIQESLDMVFTAILNLIKK